MIFQATVFLLLCSTCTGQPYPQSFKCTELQSRIAESLLTGFLQSRTMALKDWSTSLTAMTPSRQCGAITGHPVSPSCIIPPTCYIWFCCYLSVDGWERSIQLICQIYHVLCAQSPYSVFSHNDELLLWSRVPNHNSQQTQNQTVCGPCKAICFGRLTQLLPLSPWRKGKSHNATQGKCPPGSSSAFPWRGWICPYKLL